MIEENMKVHEACPYCGREQDLKLVDRSTRYALNQRHHHKCPLANSTFDLEEATPEGALKLKHKWKDFIKDGANPEVISELLTTLSELSFKVKFIQSMEEELEEFRSKRDYQEIVEENENLRTSISSLTSEGSKWLRKMKRLGIKI